MWRQLIFYRESKGEVIGHGKGSPCSSDEDCHKSRFLICNGPNKTCDCNKVVGMMWISEEKSCMLMEGAPCGRRMGGPKCVTNSSCIAGECECNDGFLRDGFGKCKLSYGEPCSDNDSCAIRYLLECDKSGNKSECKCLNNGKQYVWDEFKEKCVSTPGNRCDLASPAYWKDDNLDCIDTAECTGDGFCQCKPGFSQTPQGSCMLNFGEPCDPHSGPVCDFNQFLLCSDSDRKCNCQFQGQMKYDTDTRQCRWLAGENCGQELYSYDGIKRSPKCVADAFCKPRPGHRSGICTCLENMIRLDDGTCSRYNKGHGLPCSASIDCDKKKFLECVLDDNEGSRCDCFQNDMYFDGQLCRVRAGKSCTVNKLCSEHSYCEGVWCVCEEGYKIGTTGCIPDTSQNRSHPNMEINYQAHSENTLCDGFVQGSVERAQCHCQVNFRSHIWIHERQRCLALVGTNCRSDSDCVPNAICDVHEKICQCSASAHTTKDRTCFPYGNSRHPVDSHSSDCTEIHTVKSARSQEASYENQVGCNRCINVVIFLTLAAIVLN